MGTHPTNADREEAARPALERFMAAVAAGAVEGTAACLAADVEWLLPGERLTGRPAALARMRRDRPPAGLRWERVQPHGAHAVLGWASGSGPGSPAGTIVVEIRRGLIIFRADG